MCPGGESLPSPKPGFWAPYDSVLNAHELYECTRETCSGGNAGACWTATNYSKCDASIQFSEGAVGILCGVCESEFTFNKIRNACVSCR